MNTVEELKTDWARRKTMAGDMGILYFRETNKLYSTEMDNKSVQKRKQVCHHNANDLSPILSYLLLCKNATMLTGGG